MIFIIKLQEQRLRILAIPAVPSDQIVDNSGL